MADHNNPIPWENAMEIATALEEELAKGCAKTQIAGSLRRRKPFVNDIEILVIPKPQTKQKENDLFTEEIPGDFWILEQLLKKGTLEKRKKCNGTLTYGPRTKLLVHTASGIPVDVFSCSPPEWVNCLFSRTGGKATNIAIASNAKRCQLAWEAFGAGFRTKQGELIEIKSEKEIFAIVGLPYLPPSHRT